MTQNLASTLEVRAVMRRFLPHVMGIWTNKSAGEQSAQRYVKCYFLGPDRYQMLDELRAVAGTENVRLNAGSDPAHTYNAGFAGVSVRCRLA